MPDHIVKFQIGQKVWHVCDAEEFGIVLGIKFFPSSVLYTVQWTKTQSNDHYDIELLEEKTYSEALPPKDFA